METRLPSISVVVPVYRSENLLRPLVERLAPVLAAHASQSELILVDDGSPDGSWEIVRTLARQHAWVRGIRLMRNYGQHGALLCGIRSARHEIVVTIDDDLHTTGDQLSLLHTSGAVGPAPATQTTVEARNGKAALLLVPPGGFAVYA